MSGTLCRIVAAGDFSAQRFLACAAQRPHTLLIAADAGYLALSRLGLHPDLFLGDADSLGFFPTDVVCVPLPVEKDDTDTLAAVKEGLARGYADFELFGALGGRRFSHSLANLQTLLYAKRHGAACRLIDESCTVFALQAERCRISGAFSLFAADGAARVSVRGAKYPLEEEPLTPDFPLGVSNRALAGSAEITVHAGSVFVVTEPE